MKKVLFLVINKKGKSGDLVKYLNVKLGHIARIYLQQFSEISIEISQSKVEVKVGDISIDDFDLVYFRKVKGGDKNYILLAGTIAEYLDSKKTPYVDSLFGRIAVGTKLYPLVKLAEENLPIIPTYYGLHQKVALSLPYLERKFDFPLIAKSLHLQGLKAVYTVKDKKDFGKLLDLGYDSYLIQKFVKIKDEFRLLVLGGRVAVASKKVKRTYENFKVDYLDYSSHEEFVGVESVDPELRKIAEEAAKLLSLEIAGVDLITDMEGKNWLVEVNRGPELGDDPNISPEPEALANFFESKLR